MRAITIWQPWASLIAYGIKTRETRTHRPPRRLTEARPSEVGEARERIAIHAAKRRITGWEESYGFGRLVTPDMGIPLPLPLGAVVATAEIVRVDVADGTRLDPYGDYTAGRFYWTLGDVQRFDEPYPATGRQGWWEWQPDLCPVHRDHSGGDYCGAW